MIASKRLSSSAPVTSTPKLPSVVTMPSLRDHLVELGLIASQNFDLGVTRPELGATEQMREGQRLEWNKGIAHGLYATGTCCPEHRVADRRQHMGVLVGVDVRDTDSSRLQSANLGGGFSFDFTGLNSVPEIVAG